MHIERVGGVGELGRGLPDRTERSVLRMFLLGRLHEPAGGEPDHRGWEQCPSDRLQLARPKKVSGRYAADRVSSLAANEGQETLRT